MDTQSSPMRSIRAQQMIKDLFNSIHSGAAFSPCRIYRYVLWRIWDESKPIVMLNGLNPSDADELIDDPTITREIDFVRRWGYGGFFKLNLFAFRSPKPEIMRLAADPVGPENDAYIIEYARRAALIVVCWGAAGYYRNRDTAVLKVLDGLELYCLGLTKHGYPRHPLYLRAETRLIKMTGGKGT
jgi:hypothetical protein